MAKRRAPAVEEVPIEQETDEFYPPAVETGVISETTGEKLSLVELVNEVLAGKWGTGQDRRLRLSKAGYDHRAVQKEIVRRANGR